jgi:glucokinase
MYGARGGVYLGGGIAPAIADRLERAGFRERFERKGRFSGYLAAIPTRILMNTYAGLVGAAFVAQTISAEA